MRDIAAVFEKEFGDSRSDALGRVIALCVYVLVSFVTLGALLFFAPWQETRQWKVDILPGEYVWRDSLYTLGLPILTGRLSDDNAGTFLRLSQGKTPFVTIWATRVQYGIVEEVNGQQVLLVYTDKDLDVRHNLFYTVGPQVPIVENGSIVQTLYREWRIVGVLWGVYVFLNFLVFWVVLGNKLVERRRFRQRTVCPEAC